MLVKQRISYCADRSAHWDNIAAELCGTQKAMHSLMYGTPDVYNEVRWWTRWRFFPMQPQGLLGIHPKYGYSGVYIPGKCRLFLIASHNISVYVTSYICLHYLSLSCEDFSYTVIFFFSIFSAFKDLI